MPEQKLTVTEAVRAFTRGSAYAEFAEPLKGSISTGQLADLVMLSQDIFQVAPEQIERTRLILTVVGGRVVFEGD